MKYFASQLLAAALLLLAACSPASYVGSYDCKVLAGEQPYNPALQHDPALPHDPFYVRPNDPFYETCEHCQGRNCSHMDCTMFPCRDERRVVQACKVDKDCKDLAESRCGDSAEGHDICTLAPRTKVAAN
ncbi:MAG TPA: hypothetical protein VJV78_06500 [Polyangiales bacterium]|nr:hypothetical protein [Polyangiales bacterium]